VAVDYTTTGLIANCKRRGFLPSGSGLSSSDILQVLTEQLRNYVTSFLKSLREEYIIASLEVDVTAGVVDAPERAVGAAFRTVKWVMSDGTYLPLSRIEPENSNNPPSNGADVPAGYTLQGNQLLLVPSTVTGTAIVSYQQRPGQLVLPSDCGRVTAIDTGTKTLTFSELPSDFVDSELYDIISGRPNFAARQLDASVDSVTSTQMVFTFDLPEGLLVGDYVCIAGETCIPQLPVELHDLVAQAAAAKIASSKGSARAGEIKDALKELREELTVLLSPRDDGAARPIISRSRLGRGFLGW
jgi:hypothetical protein